MHSITDEFTEVLELVSSSLQGQNLEFSDFQRLYSVQLYLKKGDLDRAQRFLLDIIQSSKKISKKKYIPVISYVLLAKALIDARGLNFDVALAFSQQAVNLAQQTGLTHLISIANQQFELLSVQRKTLELYKVVDAKKNELDRFKDSIDSEIRTYLLNVKELIEKETKTSE